MGQLAETKSLLAQAQAEEEQTKLKLSMKQTELESLRKKMKEMEKEMGDGRKKVDGMKKVVDDVRRKMDRCAWDEGKEGELERRLREGRGKVRQLGEVSYSVFFFVFVCANVFFFWDRNATVSNNQCPVSHSNIPILTQDSINQKSKDTSLNSLLLIKTITIKLLRWK
jgi:hypothetical protein